MHIYIHIYLYIYIKVAVTNAKKSKGEHLAGQISLPHFSLCFSCMLSKDMPLFHMLLVVLQKIRAESITLQLVELLGNENPSSSEIQFVQAVLYPSLTG